MNLKRGISLFVTVGFTCSAALEGLAVTSYAESSEIQSVSLSWNDLACGTVIADGTSDELYLEVMGFIDDIYDENTVTGDTFAVITGLDAENAPELYSGTITGENEYKVYIVIRPAEGYTFSGGNHVLKEKSIIRASCGYHRSCGCHRLRRQYGGIRGDTIRNSDRSC